jgi:glutamate dehydrogenase (NAD(P)+)
VGGASCRTAALPLAVNDHTGTIGNPEGIDAHELEARAKTGGIKDYPKAADFDAEFFGTKADVFIPAAPSARSTRDREAHQGQVIIEGANGPTTANADRILDDAGIFVIPDILANAGGVTVSYFEWVQNKISETDSSRSTGSSRR